MSGPVADNREPGTIESTPVKYHNGHTSTFNDDWGRGYDAGYAACLAKLDLTMDDVFLLKAMAARVVMPSMKRLNAIADKLARALREAK